MTKGWATGYSIPERIFKAHTRNYLKLYLAIKAYLDTQHVKLLSFNLLPTETTTLISMNIFWCAFAHHTPLLSTAASTAAIRFAMAGR